MKQSRLILLFVLLFLFQSTLAQTNFRRAKIVTAEGDTVKGFIDDQQWAKNPKYIYFKESETTTQRRYYPYMLKAVMIDTGDYYVAAAVYVDRFYCTNNNIQEVYSTDSTSKDTLFLRVLVKSHLSLFLFTDENSKEHFYMKADTGDYRELICKKVPVQQKKSEEVYDVFTYQDNRYYFQLKMAMQNCSPVMIHVDEVQYTEKDLIKLFTDYNNCLSGNKIEYLATFKKLHVTWQLFAGIDIAQLYIDQVDGSSYPTGSSFSVSHQATVGLRVIFPLSRNRQKFSILSELMWRRYDAKNDFMDTQYGLGLFTNEIHFQMNYIKLNLAFQRKIITRSVEPYFNLGLTGAYLINDIDEQKVISIYNPYGLTVPSAGEAYDDPENFDLGYFGSVGAAYKAFSAEVRYERSQGFVNRLYFGSRVRTFYILIAFTL